MKKFLFSAKLVMITSFIALSISSCHDLDPIRERLDNLEMSVHDLQSAVKALQDAYSGGKIIKSVTPLTDAKAGGWLLTFSDMSEIRIENGFDGVDGITPYLKIDQDGYWSVSYDKGETFIAILDEEGKMINAVGKDGKDGKDGEDGNDGEEGFSVKVDTNKSGYYVIQTYKESDSDNIISEIVTPYISTSSRVISSLSENTQKHTLTMKMADGKEFTFAQHYEFPTSITILTNTAVGLSKGGQSKVEFRISPSNAVIGNCKIELDKIGAYSTRASYVTSPVYYSLVKVEQVYDSSNTMKTGQYRAIIADNNKGVSYDDMVTIVLTMKDSSNSEFQISSSSFEIKSAY